MLLRSATPPLNASIRFTPSEAVDLQGHCAFCLKLFERLEGSSSSSSSQAHDTRMTIASFSHIWPYFQRKDGRKTGRLSSAKYFFVFGKDVVSGEDTYSEVPPMCKSCYEDVLKMNFLHLSLTELKKQVEAQALRLREIVAGSREEDEDGGEDASGGKERRLGTLQFFENVMKESVGRTKEFLDDLQGNDLAKVKTEAAMASGHQPPGFRGNLTCTVPVVRCDQLPRSIKKSRRKPRSVVTPPSRHKTKASPLGSISSLTAKYEKRRKELARRTVDSGHVRGFSDIVASMIPPTCSSSPKPNEMMIPLYPEVKMEPAEDDDLEEAIEVPGQEEGQESNNSPPGSGEVFEGVSVEPPPDPEEEMFEGGHVENLGDADLSNDPSYSPSENESNISSEDDSSDDDPAYVPKTPARSEVKKRPAQVRKVAKNEKHVTKETTDPTEKNKVRKRKYTKKPKDPLAPPKPKLRKELHEIKQNCDVCNVWKRRSDIYEHMRTHIHDYAVKCPNSNCGASYLSPVRLDHRHLRYHPECLEAPDGTKYSLINKCEACDFKYKNPRRFRSHLDRHETATKNFTCPIEGCGEKFSLRQSVQFHLEVHMYKKDRKVQKCAVCHLGYPLEDLASHYKSHHDASEIIKCGSCNFIFPTREHLLTHAKTHREGGIACEICADSSTKFKRPIDLRQHYFTAHEIGSKLVCEFCSKGFWLETSLKVHKQLHHLSGTKPVYKRRTYKCDLCAESVVFKVEQTLFTHKITVHGTEPYGCKSCDEKFVTLSALRNHEIVHSGVTIPEKQTYTCDGCGKMIRSKQSFTTHLLICRKTEKSHVCDTCGKGYVSAYLLGRHKKEVHSGFRHVCDICGKGLTGKGQLLRHQMIHTGERPLACHICDQRFRYKEALSRHLVAHEKYGDKFQPKGPRERGVRKGNKTNNASSFDLKEFL